MLKRKLSITAFSLYLIFTFTISSADTVNYCSDPAIDKEWLESMKRNGHHPEWQYMYNLRKDICNSVKQGDISLETAIEEFERKRTEIIKKLRDRLEKENGRQTDSA